MIAKTIQRTDTRNMRREEWPAEGGIRCRRGEQCRILM